MVTAGLSDDDLRETAYEVLLVSVGAAGYIFRPILYAFHFCKSWKTQVLLSLDRDFVYVVFYFLFFFTIFWRPEVRGTCAI